MESRNDYSPVSFAALLKANDISPRVQAHLGRVYKALGMTMAAAALGAYFFVWTHFNTTIASFAALGLLMSLQFSSASQLPAAKMPQLLGFGFFQGVSLGGLVEMADFLDPSLVPIAFISTILIFACFAGAATFSPRRSYLYLGGMLGSVLSLMFWSSLVSIWFPTKLMFDIHLWGGLAMFIGYTVFDSQVIIERADSGDNDYTKHAAELFVDLVGIFVRVLVILAENSAKNERERKRKGRR